MRSSPLVTLSGILSSTAALSVPSRREGPSGSNCTAQYVPVRITAQTAQLDLTTFANQSQLTGFTTGLASATANTSSLMSGTTELSASYDIWTELCTPEGFSSNGTLEFAIHGINFDHSYWTFGGNGSQYNYAEAALKAGHAIFFYDRLGVGKSSKPDGLKEVQLPTEIEIAATLINQLRNGTIGTPQFSTIVGVGHSFGSIHLLGLAAKYGNLLNASVLTGFSTYKEQMPVVTAGFDLMFAAEQNATKWGNLTKDYLVTGGPYSDQLNFFYYPEYDLSVFQLAEDTKGTLTLGELLTQSASPVANYTNPVFITTGAKDFIFCGGNCYQPYQNASNIIDGSRAAFPAVEDFSTYIPEGTGHAMNQHFSAPQTYQVIEQWIGQRFA